LHSSLTVPLEQYIGTYVKERTVDVMVGRRPC